MHKIYRGGNGGYSLSRNLPGTELTTKGNSHRVIWISTLEQSPSICSGKEKCLLLMLDFMHI